MPPREETHDEIPRRHVPVAGGLGALVLFVLNGEAKDASGRTGEAEQNARSRDDDLDIDPTSDGAAAPSA